MPIRQGTRVLGIDVGARRVGLAVSDASRTLARPLLTLKVHGREDAVAQTAAQIARLQDEEDGLVSVVVGLPKRLDGSPHPFGAEVALFIRDLARRTALPVVPVEERLTSREAESRLAERERDWRRRKERLDRAAAAILLQDYLDASRDPS
jgi:putative Holliday junction resolvase